MTKTWRDNPNIWRRERAEKQAEAVALLRGLVESNVPKSIYGQGGYYDAREWIAAHDAAVAFLAALPPSAPAALAREDEPEPTHPWDGMPDGHNCASCGPESIWKCDRPAHPPRPAGRVMPTRAEYVAEAERIVDGLVVVQPYTAAGRALLERLDRYERRRGGAPQSWRDGLLDIEAEMYDLASNEGYHSGIADCKEHDPAHQEPIA